MRPFAIAMVKTLLSPETARNAALAASLVCVWLAAHYAQKVRKEHPRAFTALSLFALNWAVLLLYYLPGAPEMELLSSIGGFVVVAVGGLLYRQARENHTAEGPPSITWLDTLPLFLFRSTVFGIGLYYLAQRLFHAQWGWGTLALALWGTLFSALGYFAVWIGVVYLYRGHRSLARVAAWFGALAVVYTGAEVTYAFWYVRDYWPAYSRYVALRARPGSPDFQAVLPLHPQPDWPEAAAWSRLSAETEHGAPATEIVGLTATPRTPDPWVWLTYSFCALKVIFTVALLWLVLRLPDRSAAQSSERLLDWLDRRLRLGGAS